MTIFALVASHKNVDLNTVAHLADGARMLPETLKHPELAGTVILSTCNRLEIYGEITGSTTTTEQALHAKISKISAAMFTEIAEHSGLSFDLVSSSFDVFVNESAAHHLFTVSSGLESAVVGEREITGQVRRAIAASQEAGHSSGNLVRLFNEASHTARQVGQQTLLGAHGRSVVSVALDLADEVAEGDWAHRTALIFGTGAYAGATVVALRDRGCTDIRVYSQSDRAVGFAQKRQVTAVSAAELHDVFSAADVVIGCSGAGDPMPADQVPAGKHIILDLALSRDFAPEVAQLPEVELITLESVRLAAPEETDASVTLARTIVDNASAEFAVKEKARSVDAAIVALREHTMSVLEQELTKVRHQHGCGAAAEEMELAMRRMVKSLLHTPTVRARQLAKEGREEDYAAALEALYGIEVAATPAQTRDISRSADAS